MSDEEVENAIAKAFEESHPITELGIVVPREKYRELESKYAEVWAAQRAASEVLIETQSQLTSALSRLSDFEDLKKDAGRLMGLVDRARELILNGYKIDLATDHDNFAHACKQWLSEVQDETKAE